MREKYYFIVALVAMLLLGYVGVVGSEEKVKEITILSISSYTSFLKKTAESFERDTGIKVVFEDIPWAGYYPKASAEMAAGSSTYDLFVTWQGWTSKWASQGYLANIDNLIPQELKESFVEAAAESAKYLGKFYGFPTFNSVLLLFYRTDLFKEAGINYPPTNWDELIETAKKLTLPAKGQWGHLACYSTQFMFPELYFRAFLQGAGGKMYDEKWNPSFNCPEGYEALQFMVDLLQKYKVTNPASLAVSLTDFYSLFAQGNHGMAIGFPLAYGEFNNPAKSNIVGKFDVAIVPGKRVRSATTNGAQGMVIPISSKKQKAALDFLKYSVREEDQKNMLRIQGWLPAIKNLYTDPQLLREFPILKAAGEQLKYPSGRWAEPEAMMVSQALREEVVNALYLKKTPQQALSDAEKKVREILIPYIGK